MKTYYVSPSDITFLWSDCPRCFYQKIVQKKDRPKAIFPKVFNLIDRLMKNCFLDKNLRTISPDYPDAVFKYPDQWVKSKPIKIQGHDIEIVFRGKIDGMLEYTELAPNGKPIMGLPDLKTTEVNDDILPMYGLSLHTYVYCLENAAPGEFSAENVDNLGLIVFEPNNFEQQANEEPKLNGIHYWIQFEKDMDMFKTWMGTLAKVLCADEPPEATETCAYCNWQKQKTFETHV